MQDPRSRKDWMLDVLDEQLPPDTPLELLWYGRYGDLMVHGMFELSRRYRQEAMRFPHLLQGRSIEQSFFDAFTQGISLLLGNADPEPVCEAELRSVQESFLATTERELLPIEALGYVLWALYESDALETGDGSALRAATLLELTLTYSELCTVMILRGEE